MDACIPMEALGTLDTLGPDDPRRRHVERCARCSAMLVAYREFLRADAPRNAHVGDADTRLAAFIKERIEGIEATAGAPRKPRGRWFEMPSFRFAAAAAVMVVIAGVVAQQMRGPDEPVVRGETRTVVTLDAPRVLADGAIALSWTSVPDADSYQVVLLRDDLSEIVRTPATHEQSLTLDRGSLPSDATRWQVAAFREGAVAAESTPEALPE
ncbi:MAG TPA: hypothetical protein VEC56_12885 [Candidatus Krumholzibacteria bacterium]|nr:hypothetical protein [Candidatus Krumholzibacteria bacterium]